VDTEWSKKWVDQQTPMVREAIINGNFRIGRDTTGTKGEAGANLMLPLPGNPEYPEPFNPETHQKLLQRDHGYSVSVPIIDPETGASSTFDFELGRAMRSGGFPMCPNYWDAHGGDNPGPLNHASKDVNQDGEIYKFPNKVVGSPLVGDPELHFCRKWQEKYDATCCATYLDEDIQEEYEELVSTAPPKQNKIKTKRPRAHSSSGSDSSGSSLVAVFSLLFFFFLSLFCFLSLFSFFCFSAVPGARAITVVSSTLR
jgi:hypothetical protein